MKSHWQNSKKAPRPLRLGFVPLCDCAPLVMAQELGLFNRHGLRVQLSREVGWATVRDKIIYGELDAAHALAPMVFAASLGLGSAQTDCVTGLVLSLNGNAITLAQWLWDPDKQAGHQLGLLARGRRKPLVFGIPFLYSSHHFLMRSWLHSHGLVPERDAQFVVVPPPQMPANLKAGHLDGYCVGEPWNSVATLAGFGWHAASSHDIAPQHPEKMLLVRREFAESRSAEHGRLIAALVEACRFCDAPKNRERIIETLGESQYVNAPASALREGCEFTLGHTADTDGVSGHKPSAAKGDWVLGQLRECGLLPASHMLPESFASTIFREDIFENAIRSHPPHETTPILSRSNS